MKHSAFDLTPREKEALELVRSGLTRKQAAEKMGCGYRAVIQYLVTAFDKERCKLQPAQK